MADVICGTCRSEVNGVCTTCAIKETEAPPPVPEQSFTCGACGHKWT
jgi:hypothetical protein